jgi:hypothetical protein
MTHRHVWLASALVLSSLGCSLLAGGVQGSRPTASVPAENDVDHDTVADSRDNCPLTANSGQEDGDASGIGDACESPWAPGLAFTDAAGIIQLSVDERLRPVRIAGQGGLLDFGWSADATTVDLTIAGPAGSWHTRLAVDLGDLALLAALDAWGDLPGAEELRSWVAANPQRVYDVARGAEPAPQPSTPGSAHLTPPDVLVSCARAPSTQSIVREYLDQLYLQAMIAIDAGATLVEQHPQEVDPTFAYARLILEATTDAMAAVAMGQYLSCEVNCTASCRVPCRVQGACNVYNPKAYCTTTSKPQCGSLGGLWSPDEDCPNACWISTDRSPPTCVMIDIPTCRDMVNRANQQGRGYDVTPVPCPGQNCDDPICAP